MIYRMGFRDEAYEHQGYVYAGSRAELSRLRKERAAFIPDDVETLQTPKTKKEVLRVLRLWAEHPDNG